MGHMSQFQDMWPTVVERCSNIGTRPEIAIGRGLAAIDAFVRRIPVIDCLITLRSIRHQNATQQWKTNDRMDLLALSVAIPYSSVVATERQWAHLARRAGLNKKYDTYITNSLNDAINFLTNDGNTT
jgi:hypothetical protein